MAHRLQLKATATGYMARRVYYIPALGIKYNIKGRWRSWTPPPAYYPMPKMNQQSGWMEVAANAPVFMMELRRNEFSVWPRL